MAGLEGAATADSDAALKSVAVSIGGETAVASLYAAHERKPLADARQALVQAMDLAGRIAERAAKLT